MIAWKVGDCGFEPSLAVKFRRKKMFLPCSLVKIRYCGKPPWPWSIANSVSDRQGGGPRVVVSTAAFHARVRGSVPGLGGLKETKLFLPHPRVKVSIVGSLRDREVACSASDRQGSNFESCVWRTVSSQSSHHPQEVLLAQFSLYVHKGGLKPDSFHFVSDRQGSNFESCVWRAVSSHSSHRPQ